MRQPEKWRRRIDDLKADTYALYLACRAPRVPWYAKVLGALVVGYALSPIDLIPDFVPVVGYLDDLILVPLGIAVVLRLIPPEVMAECRERARRATADAPGSWRAAVVVVGIWVLLAGIGVAVFGRALARHP